MTAEERGIQAVIAFRSQCSWISEDAHVPHEIFEGVVKNSAWWVDHPKVGVVRSPGDARHLHIGKFGYRVYGQNGGNSFEVSYFVAAARIWMPRVAKYIAEVNGTYDPKDVRESLADHANSCVSNDADELYPHYGETGWLPFGNHGINTVEAAEFLLQQSGFYDITR